MNNNNSACIKIHQQYRIVAECNNRTTKLALAGFCAEEQTEATLFRYLQNMCLLSDGILSAVCNCCSTPQSKPCVLIRLPSLSKHIFCRYLNKVASVCSSAQKPAKASLVVRLLHSATIRYCW